MSVPCIVEGIKVSKKEFTEFNEVIEKFTAGKNSIVFMNSEILAFQSSRTYK